MSLWVCFSAEHVRGKSIMNAVLVGGADFAALRHKQKKRVGNAVFDKH